MLYIFQVDIGQMVTFDLDFSVENVKALKDAISAKCNISIKNQVLLISGGDYLQDKNSVMHYSGAGTDTNPIFLFDKSVILNYENFSLSQLNALNEQLIDDNYCKVQNDLESSEGMVASFETIVARTETAKKLNQLTVDLMFDCESLIREQHLQYQGWCAVIANLDDVANSFIESMKCFEESLKLFLSKKSIYLDKLKIFKSNLDILEKIKIMPSFHEDNKDMSFLSWISQKDKKESLEKIYNYCSVMLEKFDDNLLKEMIDETKLTIQTIEDNKKIKKIETRLYNLDTMLRDCKKCVQDQKLLTVGFVQNQNSANSCKDPSIYPDLCCSHDLMLKTMLSHYTKAFNINKKFLNSKRELTLGLLTRLKTIMVCETELNNLNFKVLLFSESLKKLKRSLEVVDQVNLAPKVYFNIFHEAVRRKKFNFFFNLWATKISKINSDLINEENDKRMKFKHMISNHFLKSFFPQFDDYVPEFATELPPKFDENIPKINENDFLSFIKNNESFDPTLEEEDNFLTGFVLKMVNTDENDISDLNNKDKNKVLNELDKILPVDEIEDEIEKAKSKLYDEYLKKVENLKVQFQKKLNKEITKINQKKENIEELVDLKKKSKVNSKKQNRKELKEEIEESKKENTKTDEHKKEKSIYLENKNSLEEVNSEILENKKLKEFDKSNESKISIKMDNLEEKLKKTIENQLNENSKDNLFSVTMNNNDEFKEKLNNFNDQENSSFHKILFKSIMDEVLTFKYTDYIEEYEMKYNSGPKFISFVTKIFSLAQTKKNFF